MYPILIVNTAGQTVMLFFTPDSLDALAAVYTAPIQDLEDREFLDALYPLDEDDSMRDKSYTSGSKYTQFPIPQFILIKMGFTQGIHMSLNIPCITKPIALSFSVYESDSLSSVWQK